MQTTLRRIGNLLVTVVFLGGSMLSLFHGMESVEDPNARKLELRDLAPRPDLPGSWSELASFPVAYEKYFDDHFGMRRQLIHAYMVAKGKGLGVSPSKLVVLGEQGWLYFTKSGVFPDYRGEIELSDVVLRQWRGALEDRQRWLAGLGIPFVFAMAPNKVTICPEHLPARLRQLTPVRHRIDQIQDELAQRSDFRIVDLRAPLREFSKTQCPYLVTDSHWTVEGAFVGYQSVMQALRSAGVDRQALPRSAFRTKVYPNQGDLARMLPDLHYPDEQKVFLEPIDPLPCKKIDLPDVMASIPKQWNMWEPPTAYECPGQEGVLLMFKDSFAWQQMEWFACHFRYSFFLSMFPNDPASLQLLVQVLHPTVVVEQRVERNMEQTPWRLQKR